jgi:hypothetical protein
MLAKNHFPDIMGINLDYALKTYDWQDWYPVSDNGITVTGFRNESQGLTEPDNLQNFPCRCS